MVLPVRRGRRARVECCFVAEAMRMKPLIVGEANPYGGDPEFALWPAPRGASGDRLCRLVMGLDSDTYVEAFDRVNLFPMAWRGAREARERAIAIEEERAGGVLVLLGKKVQRAFRVVADNAPAVGDGFVVLPHPSGLNRVWNDPLVVGRCRDFLRFLIPDVPFGEVDGAVGGEDS